MKRVSILLILIIITAPVLGQDSGNSKLGLLDLSSTISDYKIFSTSSTQLPQYGERGYNIDYAIGMFFACYAIKDSVFTNTQLAKDFFQKRSGKRRNLEHRRKFSQNIFIGSDEKNNIEYLGRNRHNTNKIIDYFTINTPRFSGSIYQSISKDGGNSWEPPTVAIKHNNTPLYGWEIIDSKSQNNRYNLTAILTDNSNLIYLSNSLDKGKTWSYPTAIFKKIKGINFNSSMYHNELALVFKITEDYLNFSNGDILVWLNKYRDLVAGKQEGKIIKIATNSAPNEIWEISHTDRHNIFLIKSTVTSTETIIEGYLLPTKPL